MADSFLQWAGGKRRLLPVLTALVEREAKAKVGRWTGRYFEPFLGGGALFFWCQERGLLDGRGARLNDFNPDLVAAYEAVRDRVWELGTWLAQADHEESWFLALRDRGDQGLSRFERGARFLYINRTCFNGLWQMRPDGRCGSGFGKRLSPLTWDMARLSGSSLALRGLRRVEAHGSELPPVRVSPEVELWQGDFEAAVADAGPGDLVYLDPPYVPLSDTAKFVGYTTEGFDEANHRRVAELAKELDERGALVVVSNSSAPWVYELYGLAEGRFSYQEPRVGRLIASDAERREDVKELLIFNRDVPFVLKEPDGAL